MAVNDKRQESKIQQNALAIELLKTIERFEKESKYQFEVYEVDNVLLDIVKRNHEEYIHHRFKNPGTGSE